MTSAAILELNQVLALQLADYWHEIDFNGGREASGYYMFHPCAPARMAEHLPDVKIMAMLRDPVERAFSAYKHELARGFETESFERALALEDERLAGQAERMLADASYQSAAHRHQAYVRRGQYAEQLERLRDHFPAEQIHVVVTTPAAPRRK